MAPARRLLILGGTGEAVALAARAVTLAGIEVTTSLAGRTAAPTRPAGALRRGGFGGADGLRAFLAAAAIDAVIDATHPFAARISRQAEAACAERGIARLVLIRPPWRPAEGDRWLPVPDLAAAAAALPGLARRVFLATGHQGLARFATVPDCWFLVRLIDPPAQPLPLPSAELLIGRGPFALEAEQALLAARRIEAVVSKNSGGAATYAKIAAARALGLPVVMVERPPKPSGESVESVDDAVRWLKDRFG